MLLIRPAQMEVFRAATLRAFEDEMLKHLARFSPPLFQVLGPERLRGVVRLGMTQAASYGLDRRGPVRLYLELMLLFGSRFDTDPQYPWAAEVLADMRAMTQIDRAERLYERTMDYRRRVAGADDAYALLALGNIRAFAAEPMDASPADFTPFMLAEIAKIYPEKADFVGAEALTQLLRRAAAGARNQRFGTFRGMALVAVLMLAFGHGCGADPLYPWIGATLKDERLSDPEAKARRLEKKALTWLDRVLENLGPQVPS